MLTVRTAAFSKLKSVIEVMVSLDDRSKTCSPLPVGVADRAGCGRSARFTDEPCGPPTRPAKKGHVLCSSCMGMKKAAIHTVRLLHLVRASTPVRHCGRTAIICDSCYLQEKSGALQQLPAVRFFAVLSKNGVSVFDAPDAQTGILRTVRAVLVVGAAAHGIVFPISAAARTMARRVAV